MNRFSACRVMSGVLRQLTMTFVLAVIVQNPSIFSGVHHVHKSVSMDFAGPLRSVPLAKPVAQSQVRRAICLSFLGE